MESNLLEFRILSFMRSRAAYLKYSPIIKEHMFETRETKYIFKLMMYYHKKIKGKTKVPLSSLFTLVSSRIKDNESEKYKEVIRKVKRFPFEDTTIADDVVKEFAKRQNLKIMIMDSLQSLDKEERIDSDRLRQRLEDIIAVESNDLLDSSYDYFSNPAQRLEDDKNEPRVATLISEDIDASMRRGLAAGEVAIIVAPTKVGKTLFLINVSYNAIKQGKRVVYVTLELSGRKVASRFDCLVTKRTYEELEENPSLVFKATKKLAKTGGGLRIKDSTTDRISVGDLSVYLENLRKDFEFDLVVVDQADLMYSPKEYKERRYELSSIIIGLRRMGARFKVPIWTASQATRIAGAAGNTSMWDIAEDIGKANWADVIMTLSQTEEDRTEGIIFLKVDGNRIGPGNPRVMLHVDYHLMSLKEGNIDRD